jgi:hypothetical protein
MLLPKQFNNIYYSFDQFKRLNLLFQNDVENYSLYFDGVEFIYRAFLTGVGSNFHLLKHSIEKDERGFVQVNSITQREDDMTFILFNDGTIFQLYFMMDDENSNQILSEFSKKDENIKSMTPLGINHYEAAFNRFKSGRKDRIKIERKM